MTIGTFSVKNSVLINILMVTILVLGFISLRRLPRENFPDIPFYEVVISQPYPGVGAEDIEQLISIPIENEMNGLDDVDKIESISSEGLSVVTIEFKSDIRQERFDKLFQDVRTRFSRVSLPDDVLQENISSFSSNDFAPVIEVVISGDVDYSALVKTAEDMRDEILKINEVSDVELVGVRDRQLAITVDRRSQDNFGLTLDEIVRALQLRNLNIPGGTVSTETSDYLIRTVGELKRLNEFGDVIIRRGQGEAQGGIIYIRDVAHITEEFEDNGIIDRFNGSTAVTMRITKIPGGNSLNITDEVTKTVRKWEIRLTDDINIDFLNDSTIQIKSSLNILLNNAVFGLMLLVIILFLFLGLRNALMTALGIPLAFAITFIILDLLGETFNSNTLFGLVLVLGLIVDHAIVIIENSYRLRQEGLPLEQAAIRGTDQMVLPVIAATATTVAAFLPLMILPGTIGKFLRIIPLTVSAALIASTLEAMLFLPSHFAEWPGGKKDGNEGRFFNSFKVQYSRALAFLYRHRKPSIAVSLLIMVLFLGLTGTLRQDLFSAEDFTYFNINIEMPAGTAAERTDAVVRQYEKELLPLIGNGEVSSVSSYIGFQASRGGNTSRGNVAQILVDLTESSEGRKRSITQIMDNIRDMTAKIPGPEKVLFKKAVNGPPQDPSVSLRLFGDDLEGLKTVSARIAEELNSYPQLLNIEDDYSKGIPELRIVVNEERAAAYGLSIFSVGQFIRAAVDGIKATAFVQNNDSIDVIVRYDKAGQFRADELEQLLIPSNNGKSIPFSALAHIEEAKALSSIKRIDGERVVTITSDTLNNGEVPEINRAVSALVEKEYSAAYPDQRLVIGGEFAEFKTLLFDILRIFLIGIFLIYLILGTQFKSYTQPFLILFSVPMAFAGIILYLFVSGTPFSTTVLYAGVALAGIAVNDAIVLISFINELRKEGLDAKTAVEKAASTRLRPIILTSITTIAGLLPTALGIGGVSVVWQPMASTIIFGLLFSTLTALILIPLLYGLLYDREKHVKA